MNARLAVWVVAMVAAASGCAGGDASSSTGATGFGSNAITTGATDESTADASTDGSGTDGSGDDVSTTAATTTTSADTSGGDTGPCEETTWYFDGDGDGRGDPNMTIQACAAPPNYVPFGDDCDDTDPAKQAGADEVCDAIDNDCDGSIDEASATNLECNGCSLFAIAGRSYAFCPAGAAWDPARTQCAAFSGDLLRIDDEAESASIVQLPEPASAVGGGWFIGLSDIAARGTFVWIDGGALVYTAWLAGEPNDAGGLEDCAEMDQAGGGWNDVPCDLQRAFICESAAP